jgi:hypothetical protein
MTKCQVCEIQPSTYLDPVDYQQVCKECFFKIVSDMLGPQYSEDVDAQNQDGPQFG